ncbi:MAG: hypothetical protein ACE5E8_10475 [Acidimicrobiia bacterium]
MSAVFAVVAFVVTLNPTRTRLGLSDVDDRGGLLRYLIAGTAAGAVVLGLVAAASGAVLRNLEVSPETFRIAAGFVLVLGAVRMTLHPVPHDEPVASGWRAMAWPIAFPRFITPEMVMLSLTAGASDGAGSAAAGLGAAAVVSVGLGAYRPGPLGRRVLVALGLVVSALVMLVGVWLALRGIREV